MEKMYDVIEEQRGEVKDGVYKALIESYAEARKQIKPRGLYKVYLVKTIVDCNFMGGDKDQDPLFETVVKYEHSSKLVQERIGIFSNGMSCTQEQFEELLNMRIGYPCRIEEDGCVYENQTMGENRTKEMVEVKEGRKTILTRVAVYVPHDILYKWEKIN